MVDFSKKEGNYQMLKGLSKPTVKIVRPRISKFYICSFCNAKPLFKKEI